MIDNTITIPQAVLSIIFTIAVTLGGAYLALRDGGVERQTKIEYLEKENETRRQEVRELKLEVKELRDVQVSDIKQILTIVGEIKAEVNGKQNR
jgi:uncharacterized protein (DUF2345 family)